MEQLGFEVVYEINNALKNINTFLNSYNKIENTANKVKENLKKSSEKQTSWMIAKGQMMANALLVAFRGAASAISDAFPAMSQTFEMAKRVMLANIVSPIARAVYPLLIKFMNMINRNRDVFVKIGQIIVAVFKTLWNIVSSFFKMVTSQFTGLWKLINGGKNTINQFFQFINFILFKIGFVFTFLRLSLEDVFKFIGKILNWLFNNVIKPFVDGFNESFNDQILNAIFKVSEGLGKLGDAFKRMGFTGDEENTKVQNAFNTLGEIVGWVAGEPFVLLGIAIDELLESFAFLVDFINDPREAIKNYGIEVQALTLILAAVSITQLIDQVSKFGSLIPGSIRDLKLFAKTVYTTSLATLSSFIPAIWGAVTATWAFTVALLSNPFTWVVMGIIGLVIGIIALVAGIVLLIKHWDTVKKKFKEWYDLFSKWLKEWLDNNENVKKWITEIKNKFDWFTNSLFSTKDKVVKALSSMFDIPGVKQLINLFSDVTKGANDMSTNVGKIAESQSSTRQAQGLNKSDYLVYKGWSALGFGGKYYLKNTKTGTEEVIDEETAKQYKASGQYQVKGFQEGGIVSGPSSGYNATLHGTEAIIPLAKGSIPVQFINPNNQSNNINDNRTITPLAKGSIPVQFINPNNQSNNITDSRTITINIVTNNPVEVRREVEKIMNQQPNYKDSFLKSKILQ